MTDKTVEKLADGFFRRMRLPEDIMSDAGERANKRDYIASGTSFLNLIACGKSIDYENDDLARDLLYNYCFYQRSDCIEKFSSAYRSRLIELRNRAIAGVLAVEAGGE